MARRVVSFTVRGIAQPKGSTRAFIPKGWTRPIITSANPKGKGWQQLVAEQAQTVAADGMFTGPVAVAIVFLLPRPKSLSKSIRHHVKKPDCDKLARNLLDSLSRVLYHDDACVTELRVRKLYAPIGSAPCAVITVSDAAPPDPLQLEFTDEDLFAQEALHATP
jgi:Holliday junction resolvase RusA-like endonuclease